MPAVSGSPTQLASTAANLADLAGLPDDAFKDGDFAYVQSTRATYQLDRTSAATPSSVAVDAFSGNGQWVFFQASTSWETQAAWYIDPAAGDDENDGATTATALETWAEFTRRVSLVTRDLAVTILGNIAEPLTGFFTRSPSATTASINIIGTPTVVASSSGNTTFVDVSPAGNSKGSVTVATLNDPQGVAIPTKFDGFIGYYLRAATGHSNPILSSAGGVASVGYWSSNLAVSPPAINTAVDVVQLCTTPCAQLVSVGVTIRVSWFKFTGTTLNDQSFISWGGSLGVVPTSLSGSYVACEFAGSLTVPGTQFVIGCLFTGSGTLYMTGGTMILTAGAHLNKNLSISRPGVVSAGGHIVQGARVLVGSSLGSSGNCTLENGTTTGFGIFDATGGSALTVVGNGRATFRTLFGTNPANGAYAVAVSEGGDLSFNSSYTPTITGQTAAILFNASATAIPPLVAGAATPLASALTTWADWTAAPFSRNVVSYTNGSKICGT